MMKGNKKGLRATAIGLAVFIAIGAGLAAIKLFEKTPDKQQIITTSAAAGFDKTDTTNDITEESAACTTEETAPEEETAEEPTTVREVVVEDEEQDLAEYSAVMQKLNDVLSSKRFDDTSEELLRTIFEKLYYHYDYVQRIYKNDGMRDKNAYMSDLMDTIDQNVEGFVYVKSGSADRYARKLGNNKAIYVTLEKKIVIDESISAEDLVETVLHEITHSRQRKILLDKSIPNGMKQVLTEGEATLSSVLLESTMPFFSNTAISNEDGTIHHYISGMSNTDYAVYSRYYIMLGHAAGFEILEKMKDDYDEDVLIRAIECRYHIDGKLFIEDMDTSASILTRTYSSDDLIESTDALEKSYLKTIAEDIQNADSKEKVQNVVNLFRHYKLQYKMLAYDSERENIENAFGEKDTERKLYDKMVDYAVLPADIRSELFYLIMFNYSKSNPFFVRDDTVNTIRFKVDGSTITLIGKNSEDMILYDRKTKQVTNDKASEKIYDHSKSVF